MAVGDIRAGRAFIELFLKNHVPKDLQKVQKHLVSFGRSVRNIGFKFMAAGGGIAAALAATIPVFTSMGSALHDMAQKTGIEVQQLSKLAFAAGQAGTDMEALGKSVVFMNRQVDKAIQGNKVANTLFARLGLSAQKLRGMKPDQQFLAIADALSRVADHGERAALATAIFGRGAADMQELLAKGAEAIAKEMQRAEKLGLVVDPASVALADKLGDELGNLWKQVKMVAFWIGRQMAPALIEIVTFLQETLTIVIRWVRENKGLAYAIAGVAAALVIAGALLIIFGTALVALSIIFTAVFNAIVLFIGAIAFLATPLGAVVATVIALTIATLAAAVAIAVGIGALLWWTGIIQAATERVKQLVKWLWDYLRPAIQGIGDALVAGEFALAGQIVWLTLKTIFLAGQAEIFNALQSWWVDLQNMSNTMGARLAQGFVTIWATIVDNVIAAVAKLLGVLAKIPGIGKKLEGAANFAKSLSNNFDGSKAGKAARDAIDRENQARIDERNKGLAGDVAARDQRVKDAAKELADAIKEAADKRAAAEAVSGIELPDPGAMQDAVSRAGAGVGAFSAAAAARLGQSAPALERLTKAAEETADNTDEMAILLRENPAVLV